MKEKQGPGRIDQGLLKKGCEAWKCQNSTQKETFVIASNVPTIIAGTSEPI